MRTENGKGRWSSEVSSCGGCRKWRTCGWGRARSGEFRRRKDWPIMGIEYAGIQLVNKNVPKSYRMERNGCKLPPKRQVRRKVPR